MSQTAISDGLWHVVMIVDGKEVEVSTVTGEFGTTKRRAERLAQKLSRHGIEVRVVEP